MTTNKLKTILISKDLQQYFFTEHREIWNYFCKEYFYDFIELGVEFFNVTKEDQKKIKQIENQYIDNLYV